MLRDWVDKRVAILLLTKEASRRFDLAVITGTVRSHGAGLILDRGPRWRSLTLDEDLLERFRPPPEFMRHMFHDAELILAVGVSRLPTDADCVIPFWLDVGEPSMN
jgi:hypothetical protein